MIWPKEVHAVHVWPEAHPAISALAAEQVPLTAEQAVYKFLATATDATGPKQPTVKGAYEVTW